MAIMKKLKAATTPDHQRLESYLYFKALAEHKLPLECYVNQLKGLAVIHGALERALAETGCAQVTAVWNDSLRKLPLLAEDLEFFKPRIESDYLPAIEAGKFDLAPARTSLFHVLQQSLELNHLQATKKGVALEVRCPENIPLILMDASKIEQVITNLVSNAIEHTPPATRVTITLAIDPQWIWFSVQDEGKGIPADEMEKIFKPFEKTSVKKTGGEKSTGLGMLISHKIIEAHQGKIWVESPPGRGAAFHFTLPKAGVLE